MLAEEGRLFRQAKVLRKITWWGAGVIIGLIILTILLIFVFHIYGEELAVITRIIFNTVSIIVLVLSITNLFYGIALYRKSKKLGRDLPGAYASTMIGIVGIIVSLFFVPNILANLL